MLLRGAGLVARQPASRFTHAVLTAQLVELQNHIHVMVCRFIHIWNSVIGELLLTHLSCMPHSPIGSENEIILLESYRMPTTRLSTKGQLILPKDIRTARAWGPGTEFTIEEIDNGILLRPVTRFPASGLDEVAGCLRSKGKPKTLA